MNPAAPVNNTTRAHLDMAPFDRERKTLINSQPTRHGEGLSFSASICHPLQSNDRTRSRSRRSSVA